MPFPNRTRTALHTPAHGHSRLPGVRMKTSTVSRTRPLLATLAATLLAPLAATLLALPAAVQASEPGELLSAAPYRAAWVPSKASQAYLLSYRTPDHHNRLAQGTGLLYLPAGTAPAGGWPVVAWAHGTQGIANQDRKSTRLNSSHSQISYAVF